MKANFVMTFIQKMHATGSRIVAKTRTASSVSAAKRGIKPFSHNLKKVFWLQNIKPSGIDKYDGSTNPVEWVKVY
jgi:hypothetical protein